MNIATAPRERFKISMRKLMAYGYCGVIEILKSLSGGNARVVEHIIYYPTVKDTATLADLVNRASWYLPQSAFSQVEISILVDAKLLNTDLKSLVPPPSQHKYIGQSKNIHLIEYRGLTLSQADVILLWNKRSMFNPHILWHLAKVTAVDPWFYLQIESNFYSRLYFKTIGHQQKEQFSELSKRNYQALLEIVVGCKKGYVFGTGPSLERAREFDYQGGFRVVCNTIVKDRDLLRYINPQLLVFVDTAFFFGPSSYAAKFRQRVMETVETVQCYIMVRQFEVPLLLAHYPELENKIIGLPAPDVWDLSLLEIINMVLRRPTKMLWPDKIPGTNEKYNFPTPNKFYVRYGGSVLPSFMLPVVSSVCEEIYIIGADGRKQDENYYWTHSPSSQFGDLMQALFDTHPAIFRDALYQDQYMEYCEIVEAIVHYGESLGKRYYSLMPSYVPVLAKRLAPLEKLRSK